MTVSVRFCSIWKVFDVLDLSFRLSFVIYFWSYLILFVLQKRIWNNCMTLSRQFSIWKMPMWVRSRLTVRYVCSKIFEMIDVALEAVPFHCTSVSISDHFSTVLQYTKLVVLRQMDREVENFLSNSFPFRFAAVQYFPTILWKLWWVMTVLRLPPQFSTLFVLCWHSPITLVFVETTL